MISAENIPSGSVTEQKAMPIPCGLDVSGDLHEVAKERSLYCSYSDDEDRNTSSDQDSSDEAVTLSGMDRIVEYSEECRDSHPTISGSPAFIPDIDGLMKSIRLLDPYEHEYSNIEIVVVPPGLYESTKNFENSYTEIKDDCVTDNSTSTVISDTDLISFEMFDELETDLAKFEEVENAESPVSIPIDPTFAEESKPNSPLENAAPQNVETDEIRCAIDNAESKDNGNVETWPEAASNESPHPNPAQEKDDCQNLTIPSFSTDSSLPMNNSSSASDPSLKDDCVPKVDRFPNSTSPDPYNFDLNCTNATINKSIYDEQTLAAAFNDNMAKIWENSNDTFQESKFSKTKESPLISAFSGLFRHRSSWQPTTRLSARSRNSFDKVWSVTPKDRKIWNCRATDEPCGCPPCFGYNISPAVFGNPFHVSWRDCKETSIHLRCYDNVSKNDDELDVGANKVCFEDNEKLEDVLFPDDLENPSASELPGKDDGDEFLDESEKFLWYKRCMNEVVSDIFLLASDFCLKETETDGSVHSDPPYEEKLLYLPYLMPVQKNRHPDSINEYLPFPQIDYRIQRDEDCGLTHQPDASTLPSYLPDSCINWIQDSMESDCDSYSYLKEPGTFAYSSYDNLKLGQESSNTDPNSILAELADPSNSFAGNYLARSDQADSNPDHHSNTIIAESDYVRTCETNSSWNHSVYGAEYIDEEFVDLSIHVLSGFSANCEDFEDSIKSDNTSDLNNFIVPSLDPYYNICAFLLKRNTIEESYPHYFYKFQGDEYFDSPENYLPSNDYTYSDLGSNNTGASSVETHDLIPGFGGESVDCSTTNSQGRTSPCPSITSSVDSTTWYSAETASICNSQNSTDSIWCSADSDCGSQEAAVAYPLETPDLAAEEQEKDYWTPLPVCPSSTQEYSQKWTYVQRRSHRERKKLDTRNERNQWDHEMSDNQPYLFHWTNEGLQNHYKSRALPAPMNSFLLDSEADFPTLEQSKSLKNASKKIHVPP